MLILPPSDRGVCWAVHCVGAPREFGRSDIAMEEERLGEWSVLVDEKAQPVLVHVYRRMVVELFFLATA